MSGRPMFVHVPKCAGTSVIAEMVREYGADGVFRIYGDTEERLEALRTLPADELARIRAFGGHVPFGIDSLVGGGLRTFAMLRHPVDRIVSHYAFVVRHRDTPMQGAMVEGIHSLDDYVVHSPAAPLFNNGMVRYLGGDGLGPTTPADRTQLDRAIARIRDGSIVIGLQDRYAESMALFTMAFGWERSRIARSNTRADGGGPEIGAGTRALIERHNTLDLELYEVARTEFTAKVARTPGIAREVRRLGVRSRRAARGDAIGRAHRAARHRVGRVGRVVRRSASGLRRRPDEE